MVQVLHQTDIYVPPVDPDDHYDLACQFALTRLGHTELSTVLIDWPPLWHNGAPAVDSIAQMGLISGTWPRVTIGTPGPKVAQRNVNVDAAAELVLQTLAAAPEPMDIHIVGSCRDVARAAEIDQALLGAKCRRIYVNAGSSKPFADAPTEYNTAIDPAAYQAMFALPCPTYWIPCFEVTDERVVAPFASHWSFEQGPLLVRLPDRLRQYFIWALDSEQHTTTWFEALESDNKLSDERWNERRSMWSTAGFLHGAGLAVLSDGSLAEGPDANGAFDFVPVDWSCDNEGRTTWSRTSEDTGRYLIHVTDVAAYEPAMTEALVTLLSTLNTASSPG